MTESEDRPRSVVRSFALTGGRTKPVVDLPLECVVHCTTAGLEIGPSLQSEQRQIVEICGESGVAVAEIAGRLQVPLAVARVLVGDMAHAGHVQFTRPIVSGNVGFQSLLEKVLDGLQGI